MRLSRVGAISMALLAACVPARDPRPVSAAPRYDTWTTYGGNHEQNRYSNLTQINRQNVSQLAVAWTFDTGETGAMQTQPIVVDGVLYANTPSHKVFALDAATGRRLWLFDPGIAGSGPNRGVMYWAEGSEHRVFAAVESFIYALDARTGAPMESFGVRGRIDLREHLDRDPATQQVRLTSPGVVYRDLMIVGGRVAETLPASPGDIRAYDVRTGAVRWTFHTIPRPGEDGYDTWPKDAWRRTGGANNWAGMALDEARGIVYVPTGSAAADFYGADRIGDNLFANSLVALDARTGKRLWHFQVVRHDIWDRDLPSPPTLGRLQKDGRAIDVVMQATKHGYVFVFDRITGKPVFPIEYKKFPPTDVAGEVAADTQPIPTRPAPFARQQLTEDLLTNRTPEMRASALGSFRMFRSGGQFVPLGTERPTVMFPGFDGGAEWGGQAFDPTTGLYYVNANDLAWTGRLMPETFRFTGYRRFLDPEGFPAVAPPWGTLTAIDMNTGEHVWRVPLGEYPELALKGLRDTGSENYGGPVVTAGGLVFIAATNHDRKMRAFDKTTGALLWEATMPSTGNATPAVYEAGGRQFVAIAAGGGQSRRGGPGGVYVAFALPR
jgi:quinoprotein glucose dehydrogenase